MSKSITKAGQVGFGREPGSSPRARRNGDTNSSALRVASGVPDTHLKPMTFTGVAATDFATLVDRIKVLESANNALLATLRAGQVIDGDQ